MTSEISFIYIFLLDESEICILLILKFNIFSSVSIKRHLLNITVVLHVCCLVFEPAH